VGVLGPYRVVRELGKGGMGAVYLAVDTRLDRKLALKVMLPEFAANGDAKERFIREAKAVAQVGHDNVVTIYEADERDGVPYLAMQFLQGYPLDEFLKKKGCPPVAQCVRIGIEAARGLAAAHELGLVHRDIKPANLWLEAPNGRVKVLDFGLAKPVGTDAELTKCGAVVGTPAYMSPEQARGLKVDARTDIFSLGSVMYRLLAGKNPFAGENIMAVLMALGTEEPTPIRELNPNVPEALAAFVHRMMAKKPAAGPQTAAEVAQGLRAALAQPSPSADQSQALPVVVQPVPVEQSMHVTIAPESAFANLTDEDEPTEAASAEPVARARRAGGKGPLLAVGAAVLLAGAAIAVLIALKGKSPEVAKEPDPPPADTGKEKPPPKPQPKPKASDLPPVPAHEWKPVPAGASSFDKLDANAIPKEERFDWQPKELVAVIGAHARQHWEWLHGDNFAFSPDGKWAVTVGVNKWHQEDAFALHEVATGREVSRVSGTQALGKLFGGAAFSPDSKAVLLALEDGVSVGRYADGAWTFQRLNGQSKYHWPVVLADGKTLALGAKDASGFELWDIDGERFKRRKTVERGGAILGTSADRKWLYLARDNAADKPFELEVVALDRDDDTRKVLLTLPAAYSASHGGGGSPGPAACVSSDGTTLAVLAKRGWEPECSLYDLTANPPKEKAKFTWDGPPTGHMRFAPDGKTLLRRYTNIHRTDVSVNPPRALAPIRHPEQIDLCVGGFAVSPDCRTLITNQFGAVLFFDLSGAKPKELHPFTNTVQPARPSWRDVFVSPARGLLAVSTFRTGARDYTQSARFWDLTGTAPKPWPNEADSFTGPAGAYVHGYSAAGTSALVYQREKSALGLARVTATGIEPPGEPAVNLLRPSTDNGFCLVAGAPPKLWHLDEPSDKAKPLPDLDTNDLKHFAVRDDRALVTTVNGNRLTLWNVTGEKPVAIFSPTEPTTAAFFTPDGKRLIAVGRGRARAYDLTGRTVTKAPVQPTFAATWATVTPDSRVAVFTTFAGAGGIRAVDLNTGADVWQTALPGPAYWVRMAPDNRHLFTHNANGSVYVLRLDLTGAKDRPAAEFVLNTGGQVTIIILYTARNDALSKV
jgi:serine/threonine protein kinase